MESNPQDNRLRTQMLVDSCVGLMLVVGGIAAGISYKHEADIELLVVSVTSLIAGLGVLLAGSLRRDLYDLMINKK